MIQCIEEWLAKQQTGNNDLPPISIVSLNARVSYAPSTAKFNLKTISNKVKSGFSPKFAEKSSKIQKGRVAIKFKWPTPATVFVFKSSQFLIMHAKSEEHIHLIADKVDKFLAKTLKQKPTSFSVSIFNVTATYAMPQDCKNLCIKEIASEADKFWYSLGAAGILAHYEPNLFSGMVWKRTMFDNGKKATVSINAFQGGKMTITGTWDIKKLQLALKEFLSFIECSQSA